MALAKYLAGRRRGSAQGREWAGVQAQRVGELGVEQADDMTSRAEGAGLLFDTGLTGQLRHQVRRNEVAKLAQQRKLAGRWLVSSLIFHAPPCGRAQTRQPTFFYSSTINPVGQQ